MAENRHNSSSEEDDFCRISDGGHSDHGGDLTSTETQESVKQQAAEKESMPLSEYCQVVFQNVAESYKPGKPLECYYTLSPVLVPTNKDYVAVFKVGWNSVRHYVTFEYAPYPKNWKAGEEYKQCILFNYHYLPKEEDGEFYQFCYIDSYGKMRGASTPFQFLLTSMDDFMEVADESIDFLMIQSKKSQNSELILQLNTEKDALTAEKAQIEREKNQLVGKVEELEHALSVKEEEVKEFVDKVKTMDEKLEQIPVLTEKLADCEKRLVDLEAEKKRYGESLQQTTEAFMEVQNNITQLEDERNTLRKDLEVLTKERDEFKSQFASSEKDNESLRAEIDALKNQLMEVNEQNQVILAKEGALKEEKQKVEQQLLVASSDQEHKKTLETQVKDLQGQLTKSAEDQKKLEQQLKAMSDFHAKLAKQYEDSKIECDSLKTKLLRQGDDFLQKQKKMEQKMTLERHQASERTTLLETQVAALKEGIQKLAKDKENMAKGIGSSEASNIAVKAFKDKMMAAKRKGEEEAHKRLQVQKELLELKTVTESEREDNEKLVLYYKKQLDEAKESMELKARDAEKEIDSLKVRLEMAKEEYKILYREVQHSDKKGSRKGSITQEPVSSGEPLVVKETAPVQSAAISLPKAATASFPKTATASFPKTAAMEQSYDSRDMTLNMEEMTRQLAQLTSELKKRKTKVDEYKAFYEKERMRRKEAENLYQEMQESKRIKDEESLKKYRAKQEELTNWKDKYNKLHDDYLRTKHAFESYKFDTSLAKSPVKTTAPVPIGTKSPLVFDGMTPRPPPAFKYGNPYERSDESLPMVTPPGRYPNPYAEGDAANISSYQSIRNPPSNLPEPLEPQVMPQATLVAVKASIKDKHDGGEGRRPSAPPMPSEDDEEDLYQAGSDEDTIDKMFSRDIEADSANGRPSSPTIYHDAQGTPMTASSKPCPQCGMQFAADVSDEVMAKHVQSHFAYHCPECDALMDKEVYREEDYQRHLANHRSDENPGHYCPFCDKVLKELTVEQVEEHVQNHIPN